MSFLFVDLFVKDTKSAVTISEIITVKTLFWGCILFCEICNVHKSSKLNGSKNKWHASRPTFEFLKHQKS